MAVSSESVFTSMVGFLVEHVAASKVMNAKIGTFTPHVVVPTIVAKMQAHSRVTVLRGTYMRDADIPKIEAALASDNTLVIEDSHMASSMKVINLINAALERGRKGIVFILPPDIVGTGDVELRIDWRE